MRGTSVIVVAVTSGTVRLDGQSIAIRKGEAWNAQSPVVREHPDMFSSDPQRALGGELGAASDVERPVEQATRAPGERSGARRGR